MYYMFTNIIILNLYVYFMQKRLPRIYYYATVLFALIFEETVNIYLDFKLDLYGFFFGMASTGSICSLSSV